MEVDRVIKGFDAPTSVPVTAPPVQPAGGMLSLPKVKLFPEKAGATVTVSFPPMDGVLEVLVEAGIVVVTEPLVQVTDEYEVVTSKLLKVKFTGYVPAFWISPLTVAFTMPPPVAVHVLSVHPPTPGIVPDPLTRIVPLSFVVLLAETGGGGFVALIAAIVVWRLGRTVVCWNVFPDPVTAVTNVAPVVWL